MQSNNVMQLRIVALVVRKLCFWHYFRIPWDHFLLLTLYLVLQPKLYRAILYTVKHQRQFYKIRNMIMSCLLSSSFLYCNKHYHIYFSLFCCADLSYVFTLPCSSLLFPAPPSLPCYAYLAYPTLHYHRLHYIIFNYINMLFKL